MAQRSGDELHELDSRQEPRLAKALELAAPGTALREGIDSIVDAKTGGLICTGDPEDIAFLFSGGIKLAIDTTPPPASPTGRAAPRLPRAPPSPPPPPTTPPRHHTPALLYQLAKMDGAITLNANATKITMA